MNGRYIADLDKDDLQCSDNSWVPWVITSVLLVAVILLSVAAIDLYRKRETIKFPDCFTRCFNRAPPYGEMDEPQTENVDGVW